MTIRYGKLIEGSRSVVIRVMDTIPSASTMMTATRIVNGFFTLNFSMNTGTFPLPLPDSNAIILQFNMIPQSLSDGSKRIVNSAQQ